MGEHFGNLRTLTQRFFTVTLIESDNFLDALGNEELIIYIR
jgi:hypothetical protein